MKCRLFRAVTQFESSLEFMKYQIDRRYTNSFNYMRSCIFAAVAFFLAKTESILWRKVLA